MANRTPGRNPLAGVGSYVKSLTDTGRRKDYHKAKIMSLRLDADLIERVRQQARAEGVSVNAWLTRLIRQALDG